MAFCAWQYRPMRIAQNYLQKKKRGDVLDNQQNLVDCRRKQCWLPKRGAILNIGRDKIQTILCVCVLVRVRIRLTPRWEDWLTVISLDLFSIFRKCLLRVFPSTVTLLIADFLGFRQYVGADAGILLRRLVHYRLLPLPINYSITIHLPFDFILPDVQAASRSERQTSLNV